MIRVEIGDCLDLVPRLAAEGVMVDAVVTDPPYHLVATTKRFGAKNAAPAQHGRDGAMSRLSAGFMGQQWDGGDVAFRPETWATIATVMRPGGFLLAFGGTRTYHRLASAIEDGGFVIQDCIMWLFATGFPKRRDMLKPAYEPIVLAYKPGGKRTMQIDECRAEGAKPRMVAIDSDRRNNPILGTRSATYSGEMSDEGRWPANVCHDGSDEVLAAFPEARSAGLYPSDSRGTGNGTTYASKKPQGQLYADSGSAARFFFSAKAGAQDRWGSRHPTVKPVEIMKWLVALVCPLGGLVLDPFAGSGTTGIAALATGRDAILIEEEAGYVADIRERMVHYEGEGRHSLASKNRNARETRGSLL